MRDQMKFGGRQAILEHVSSYESCSKHNIHCCKCYDISELFSTNTRRTFSLSEQSSDCVGVETQFSTEHPSASSSSCKSAPRGSSSTKTRIKWTMDLHKKFIDCVNHLGGPMKATPKMILKLMRTHELTIYHVKSHLQKYRSLKHVQDFRQGITGFKEEEIQPAGSKIKQLMRLQDVVGQHLQEQLEMQKDLYLLVEAQNKQLHEMIKDQKGKNL